ncbi:stabilizer of axonemal microtubules 2 [Erinaceus europaeus]|uniref:Stabilizer of axonemal microtubules 2 n=1 Tax=Erinaceus europaeus TaxID=9365 RepID=A0ABM3WGD1_ERIEU|nr:stabilizer of axonemal microtubules 2 [Erinaceus europaeus]
MSSGETQEQVQSGGASCLATLQEDSMSSHLSQSRGVAEKERVRESPAARPCSSVCFRSDFRPHEVVRRRRRDAEQYQPPGGAVEQGTTYRRDFNPHPVQPVARARPPHRSRVQEGKVDTVPTYRAEYRAWAPQRRELCRPQQAYTPPKGSFSNRTTCQDDFPPHRAPAPRGRGCRPRSAAPRPTEPFQGDTSHRLDYVALQPQPRPTRPREAYRPSSQPLQGLTTHRGDFRGLPGTPPQPCRPARARVSPGRFASTTEFQESFPPWEVSAPRPRKAVEYMPPKGTMEAASTSRRDFVPLRVPRAVPIRPAVQRSSHQPFQARSTTQEDFPAWEGCRPTPMRRQPQMLLPKVKFEGLSTSRCHFVPHILAPGPRSCRPMPAPLRNPGPFPQGTTYALHFTPKRLQACPAAHPEPPGYIFQTTDPRGHRLFLPVVPAAEAC